jgi:hypothetical protein
MPIIMQKISELAERTDSAYNKLYGANDVTYDPSKGQYFVPYEEHFSDDLFTPLLLFLSVSSSAAKDDSDS